MSDTVLVALIAAIPGIVSAVVSVISVLQGKKNRYESKQDARRNQILQMILEDKVALKEGNFAENHQAIHNMYDEYIASGGNSYIVEKVKEYDAWYTASKGGSQ